MSKEDLLQELSDSIYDLVEEEILDVCERYLAAGYDVLDAVNEGLIDGMNRVGVAYDEEEYFVSDMLFASDTLYAALDFFKPYLVEENAQEKVGKCVIGNVEGDTHDIGKNLVKTMMDAAGFVMVDLGKDVAVGEFVDRAVEEDVDIICISTLMTTTMPNMRAILEELENRGIRDQFKVMVGGGPVNEKFAQEIGADAYSENATEAVQVAKSLVGA